MTGVNQASLDIRETNFTSCKAAAVGGAVYLAGAVNSKVIDSTFQYNMADTGGAIWYQSNAAMSLLDTRFNANRAQNGGPIDATIGLNLSE